MSNAAQKLLGIINDFFYVSHNKNLWTAILWLPHVVRVLLYNHIHWLVFTRRTNDPFPSSPTEIPVDYKIALLEDLELIKQITLPSELAYFRKRLVNGRICMLALFQEQVVAYGWMTTEVNYMVDNITMNLKDGDAYIDDIYTVPTYRGKGIGRALNVRMVESLFKKGVKRTVAIVESNNLASIKLFNANKWQITDRMTYTRLLFIRNSNYHNKSF